MNKLLQRQLQEHLGGADQVPENFSELLNAISESYNRYEKNQGKPGVTMELSPDNRKTAQLAIEKSDAFSKGIIDSLSSHIAVINATGAIIKVNRPWDTFALNNGGTASGKYGEGANYFDACKNQNAPDDENAAKALEGIKKVLDGTLNEFYLEYPCHSPKKERWFNMRVVKFKSDEMLVLIEHQNITERKQAEDKLTITSNKLQHALEDINKIMDSSLDVICAVDEHGYFLQVSAACETVWGYKADELIGRPMIDFVYPEDRERTRKAAINVIAGNNMINFENRYIRKDGSLVPVNWSARWDAKDRIRYAVARDATEKKRSEKAFEIERQRFYDLFVNAPFSVGILKGPDHIYEMANPLYLQLIDKDNVIGKSVKDVLPEIAEQGFIELLDKVYKTGVTFSAREMLIKLDKEGNGKFADVYLDFVYQAHRNKEGNIDGIFFFAIDVTEQVLSRKKIEESEKGYRQIVETAQEGIWMIDEDNITTFVNKKMAEILGYSIEEMMGKKNYCFMDDEWKEKASGHILKRKLGMSENHDFKYITKSGKTVWTNLSTNAVFDDAGIYKGALAMVTDISERKKTEEGNKFKAELLNTVGQAVIATDMNGIINFWNRAAEQIYGWTTEEAIDKNIIDLTPAQQTKEQAMEIMTALSESRSWSGEFLVRRKDGEIFPAFVTDCPIYDQHHKLSGVIGVSSDITERKKVEEELRNNELKFRTLTVNAPVGIFQTDDKGKTTYVNETWLSYSGMTLDEALGDGWLTAVHPDDRISLWENWHTKSQKGLKSSSEYRFINKEGNIRWVSGEATPMFTNTGEITGHIGTLTDITNRKIAEDKIKESELRYRSLIEQASDAICITDASMKFIDINPYGLGLLGYTLEEGLQLSLPDILFKEDIVSNPIKLNELKLGETTRNERRLKRKDGTAVDMAVSTKLMEDGRLIMFGHDITKRKKSEEALRESEKRLRQIIDLVPHFIFAKDAKGTFVLANETVAEAYGCTVEALLGKTDADYNPKKEEVEYFRQEDLKIINSGNTKYNIEETITDSIGNIRILSTTKIPYTSPGCDSPGVLGVSVDISEHKRAEAILKENEDQLTIATQIAKLGYWEFDVTKNLFKFNDQFYSIFKTTAEQVGGYTMSSERYAGLFVHPDDTPMLAKETSEAIKSPDPNYSRQIEHRIKYPDGEIGYMTFRFFIGKNELGRTIKVFGAIQDITERKKAESILKESEDQLTIATQIAKLGYWEFDVTKNLFKFNDQFYSIFNATAEAVGGYTMSSERYADLFVHPDDIPMLAKEASDSIKSPDSRYGRQIEYRIKYADGGIGYVLARFFTLKNEFGRTIKTFGAIQDITDRKKTEETLLRSEADLEIRNKQLQQKNKELEQFAFVASHDMQEPLRTTSSFVELLQKQYKGKLDEKADRYLNFILQSSDRMKVLIKDLLDYSRIGRIKQLDEVDCNIVLQEVCADLGCAIKEAGAKIEAERLPVIKGYPTEIKQLFQNLVANAIKFRRQNQTPYIIIGAREKSGCWEFTFKDNGIGIEKRHMERIFIIFQRLHNRKEYEGSGIGLAHCKKIVELHGGKIWIESKPGDGSTFYFTLPAGEQAINIVSHNKRIAG